MGGKYGNNNLSKVETKRKPTKYFFLPRGQRPFLIGGAVMIILMDLPEEGGSDFSIWQQPRRRAVAELRSVGGYE